MLNHQGFCHVWNETEGKKGANEISSALLMFIEQKVKEGFVDFRFLATVVVVKAKINIFLQCLRLLQLNTMSQFHYFILR